MISDISQPKLEHHQTESKYEEIHKREKRNSSLFLLCFFAVSISYYELIYRLWIFGNIGSDYIFPILFSIPAAAFFFLLSSSFKDYINKVIAYLIFIVLILGYGTQLVYHYIFHTPLSLYSLIGTRDAVQFWDIAYGAIWKNGLAVLFFLLPIFVLFVFRRKIGQFNRAKGDIWLFGLFIGLLGYGISILGVNLAKGGDLSPYDLYYNISSPELSVRKLGVFTTMRLDLERLIFGFEENNSFLSNSTSTSRLSEKDLVTSKTHNMIDIDFEKLISAETNQNISDMHNYFSGINPTKKNEYTGLFKGNNLIFIVAESFSSYAIDPELTPTLYKMSKEGFVFNNFYNPVWGVSTSDGEYVSDTSLLPKSGIWSMLRSGKNEMPFVLGNQFGKIEYTTKAYHNHTYTYYGRNISIPNFGYDYKGVGNGLNVRVTWPESDLEMIDKTVGEYASSTPFHAYYVTVSGHMNYNFFGNFIAAKNKSYVQNLPYSEASRAYISGNLELEFAMKSLLEKLEAAGILDNTVIALVPDHYPYGLPRESIDELAGHKVEDNFELYKSIFLLWKKGLGPIEIDKPASTLDILPTISNLFGLEYDSRLLMGRDILSSESPLVIFLNRSWITDKARYNSLITELQSEGVEQGYKESINQIVADKFKYSAKVLENDYYGKVMPQWVTISD